jgi:hypothetical protein
MYYKTKTADREGRMGSVGVFGQGGVADPYALGTFIGAPAPIWLTLPLLRMEVKVH